MIRVRRFQFTGPGPRHGNEYFTLPDDPYGVYFLMPSYGNSYVGSLMWFMKHEFPTGNWTELALTKEEQAVAENALAWAEALSLDPPEF